QSRVVDVCVVGAGPAGLAAATEIARRAPDKTLLLVDDQAEPGGSWLARPDGTARAGRAVAEAYAAGVPLLSRATVIGFFPEDVDPAIEHRADGDRFLRGTLAVATPDALLRVSARTIVYATGAYDQNIAFLDNDGPGVVSARACGRLAFRHGVKPGDRIAILDEADHGEALAAGLLAAQVDVVRIDTGRTRPVAAVGGAHLRGLDVVESDGREHRIPTDLIAVAATPAPAAELPRQHGAALHFDAAGGGYAVQVDPTFRTSAAGIFACGDVTGYHGPAEAALSGAAAGREIAHTLLSS
ncbi:MAG TPA: FAD-dependent oxidoreductase, partial [Polyangia bacterium]|nr:FAD-dependent oxidoreductase [Polyangia bacterium]